MDIVEYLDKLSMVVDERIDTPEAVYIDTARLREAANEIKSLRTQLEQSEARVRDMSGLLKVAKCPNPCVDGIIVDSDGDMEGPCQWCDFRAYYLATHTGGAEYWFNLGVRPRPADGELVDELRIVKRLLQAQIDSCASPMNNCIECDRFARGIDAVSKAITALQGGVRVSNALDHDTLQYAELALTERLRTKKKLGEECANTERALGRIKQALGADND